MLQYRVNYFDEFTTAIIMIYDLETLAFLLNIY